VADQEKIDFFIDDQAWDLSGTEPCLATLKEDARHLLGTDVQVTVTRVYQTSTGRIIFAQLAGSNGRGHK